VPCSVKKGDLTGPDDKRASRPVTDRWNKERGREIRIAV